MRGLSIFIQPTDAAHSITSHHNKSDFLLKKRMRNQKINLFESGHEDKDILVVHMIDIHSTYEQSGGVTDPTLSKHYDETVLLRASNTPNTKKPLSQNTLSMTTTLRIDQMLMTIILQYSITNQHHHHHHHHIKLECVQYTTVLIMDHTRKRQG